MTHETFLTLSVRELHRLKKLADDALAQVKPEQFFASPGKEDNSLALLVKHVSGNMLSRWTDFLTSDGEKPWRNRDSEFEIQPADTQSTLMAQWEKGWACLFAAIEPLKEADLQRPVIIRGETLSVLQAVGRQLSHYAYHVGQIVYLAKHYAGSSWRSLSIPKGQSATFNARPAKYVEPPGNSARS